MMTATNCKSFRKEIDEADLNQQPTDVTAEHLRACADCRAFHDERGGLRQLMSSLGTVAAPADFDFLLRARLARAEDSPGGVFTSGKFLIGSRALAVIALLLLVVGAGVIIRNRMSSSGDTRPGLAKSNTGVGLPRKENKTATPGAESAPTQAIGSPVATPEHDLAPQRVEPRQRRVVRAPAHEAQQANAAPANKEAVREASGLGATVITLTEPAGSFVRVPIDAQSFKVSIDDGHGSSHTISVPAVSFGSQRVGERGFSFTPVKSTRGVW